MQDNQRQTQWAYIAGIMDADGCFMIFKHNRKTVNKATERALAFPKRVESWAISYIPGVKIAMIEPEAVNFIKNEMGFGNINLTGARKDRPNSKPIYNWYLRNKFKTAEFLENVIPYLKVKKDRALHLLKFCHHLQSIPNQGYRGISYEELNYREDMYLKMREFNGNKVAATTESPRSERICDSLDS